MAETTILLVDDEEMITDVGEQLLKHMGYGVMVARNGMEAIDIFERNKTNIDMVILDMLMPGVSGGNTYDRLKELDPEIRVLLSSGNEIDEQAQEILDRGCRGFFQKPFSMSELSARVKQVLTDE